MLYQCIREFNTIKLGDFAIVELNYDTVFNTICVTSEAHSYFINDIELEKYFIRLEEDDES